MKKRKKGRRFKTWAIRQPPRPRVIEIEPDDLATSVSRAENDVLPIIAERQVSSAAAQFLLAQQRQTLVMGDPRFTKESGRNMANAVLVLWEAGYNKPGPEYPYTLEETLRGLQEGPKAKGNDEARFQPFTPANGETPRGFGEVAGGIVNLPETNVWQIGMRAVGPCTFPAASRDPAKAQSNLKQTSARAGREGTVAKIAALSRQVQSQADGELKQLPYEKMLSHMKLADDRERSLSCLTERRGDTY